MKIKFKIQNLKCANCEKNICNSLLWIEGVERITVNLNKSAITLCYRDEETLDKVFKKLSKLGYPTEGAENTIIQKATSYISCSIGKFSVLA